MPDLQQIDSQIQQIQKQIELTPATEGGLLNRLKSQLRQLEFERRKVQTQTPQQAGSAEEPVTLGTDTEQLRDQIGDLSDLAEGRVGVQQDDLDIVAGTIGAAGDIARRELEASLPILLDQTEAEAASRGLIGSSAAAANKAIVRAQGVRSLENLLSQQQQQAGGALLSLPFQRANVQLNANQLLFGQLLGTNQQILSDIAQQQNFKLQKEANKGNFLGDLFSTAGQIAAGPVGGKIFDKVF